MLYLTLEIIVYLLAAALIGLLIGWLLRGFMGGGGPVTDSRLSELRTLADRRLSDHDRVKAEATKAERGFRDKLAAAEKTAREAARAEWEGKYRALEREMEKVRADARHRTGAPVDSTSSADAGRIAAERQSEVDRLRGQLQTLQVDLADCASRRQSLIAELEIMRADRSHLNTIETFAAAAVAGPLAADDLKQITGVGPTIERQLQAAGVYAFRDLARMDAERTKELAQDLGIGERIASERWVEQAANLFRRKYGVEP